MANFKKNKYWAEQRVVGKTYFSAIFKHTGEQDKRIANKILENDVTEYILKDEKTIGFKKTGLRQINALFLENERKIPKLIIQQFGEDNEPLQKLAKEVSFDSAEVESLYLFLKSIKETKFPDESKFNVQDSELQKMLLVPNQVNKLVINNLELIQEALNNNVSTKDIINLGYRKNQLEIFEQLLNQESYFIAYKESLIKEKEVKSITNESVWQHFFEKNTWILGYGLDYIFNTELEGKKLEQVTSGANFSEGGKRTDGLLKSQGAINSLCFCELKLSSDDLLKQVKDSYRGETWQISDQLSGAIAQVQRTVHKAIKQITTKTEIKDKQDNLTGENLYLYNPKAFILIGNLNEFIVEDKVNEMKFSSFEMFRKNLRNIEILTFDELYQRAYYICNKKE